MTLRNQAFVRRGWNLGNAGSHWVGCHKSHPACAYLLGWADAMARERERRAKIAESHEHDVYNPDAAKEIVKKIRKSI